MERNLIGTITKPQALKGEFRVKPSLLNLKTYKKFNKVWIENIEYNVEKVILRDTFVIFKVSEINSCDEAEKLRNKKILAEIELDVEDNFDIVDFDVFVDGESLGKIVDISNYGSKDIMTIQGKSSIMLPIIDGLIEKTNKESKLIECNKNIFEQVAVYEN